MLHRSIEAPRAGAVTHRRGFAPLAALAAAVVLGACAQSGQDLAQALLPAQEPAKAQPTAAAPPVKGTVAAAPAAEKSSSTAAAQALGEARSRRLAGDKAGAMAALEKAAAQHPKDRLIAKERAFLALELGQLASAESQLRKLANPKSPGFAPDWRVHSALGAALSATGKQEEARIELTRALALAPDHPSILNNLALTYALEGRPGDAEQLMRRAASVAPASPKAQQNLALVLGLNGRIEEAETVAAKALPPEKVTANSRRLAALAKPTEAPAAPAAAPAAEAAATPPPERATKAAPSWQSTLFNLGGPRN